MKTFYFAFKNFLHKIKSARQTFPKESNQNAEEHEIKNDFEAKTDLNFRMTQIEDQMKTMGNKFDEIMLRFEALAQKVVQNSSRREDNDEEIINEIFFEVKELN